MMIIRKIKEQSTYLAGFFSGQMALQFLNLLNGFILIRWLSIEDQAIFSVLLGIQTLMGSLSDLGFSASIIALTGDRILSKKVLGSYMIGAMNFRRIFFLVTLILILLLAPFLSKDSFQSDQSFWLFIIPVVVAIYFQADCSIYAAPLIIHKRIRAYYRPLIITSILRLPLTYILFLTDNLNALTVLSFNALIILYIGIQYKRSAKEFYDKKVQICTAQKEMFKYLLPLLPSTVFNSFFGQFQIFLIAYFGAIQNIAEVAALGRLSQIFILLSSFNLLIVEPMIAKSKSESLAVKYFVISVFALIIAFSITLLAYLFPSIFLIILGDRYQHLNEQLFWMVAAASVNFVATTIWTMSSARKWVFWWGTIFYISVVTATQIWGILNLNLSTTTGVLQLSLFTAIGILFIQLSITAVGFLKEKTSPPSLSLQQF